MAKKKSRRGTFNMSAAVRDVLKENPKLSAKEVEAEVKKQHPGQKINSNSLSVSFSSVRKKLGITKGKKRSVKRRKPSASGRANGTVDMAALFTARKYVAEVGDVDAALEAVRQLRTLQVVGS
jgi:cell shape-determining protein MreC